jgi:hypothetical protein
MRGKFGHSFPADKSGSFRLQHRNRLPNKIALVIFLSFWQSIQSQELAGCKEYRQHVFLVEISGLILGFTASREEASMESE